MRKVVYPSVPEVKTVVEGFCANTPNEIKMQKTRKVNLDAFINQPVVLNNKLIV
jgi:hypothetical protein